MRRLLKKEDVNQNKNKAKYKMINLENLIDTEIDLINVVMFQLRDSDKHTRLAAKASLCVLFDYVRSLTPKTTEDSVEWGRSETIKLKKMLGEVNTFLCKGTCDISRAYSSNAVLKYWGIFKGVANFHKINIDKILNGDTLK